MGLGIRAYKQLKKIDAVFDADGEPIDPVTREYINYDFQAYVNPSFPNRADDLEDKAVYSAADTMGFHVGSYFSYNDWRNLLAEIAGYPIVDYVIRGATKSSHAAGARAVSSGPFWELINFTDCDGAIGATVSAKLAKDFAEFQSAVDASSDEYFKMIYSKFRKAFEMATDGGAVLFC